MFFSFIRECVICMVNPRDMIITPCGHKCLCQDCAKSLDPIFLVRNQGVCPICRHSIEHIYRIYN